MEKIEKLPEISRRSLGLFIPLMALSACGQEMAEPARPEPGSNQTIDGGQKIKTIDPDSVENNSMEQNPGELGDAKHVPGDEDSTDEPGAEDLAEDSAANSTADSTEDSAQSSNQSTATSTPVADGSINDSNSISVVVNKLRPLNPAEYAPADLSTVVGPDGSSYPPLRQSAARAAEQMMAAASAAGVNLRIVSAYRDYHTQVGLWQSYANRDGAQAADRYSARAGHSEHQTGLAADFDDYAGCNLSACFGETKGGIWLAANAPDYGFVLRYPQGKEHITGYIYEPWHFRYVGVEIATDMRNRQISTLEEYYGLPAAPGY